MNAEDIRIYCLKKAEVTESLPFNDTALVFKVNNKMFMILDLESYLRILKTKHIQIKLRVLVRIF